MSEEVEETTQPGKLDRIAIELFRFFQRCRIHTKAEPSNIKLFCYNFSVSDLTELGDAFGFSFELDLKAIEDIEDTPQGIEEYCFNRVIQTSHALMVEKASRYLLYNQVSSAPKSSIILP